MKFERKVIIRNLVIAMVVADGVGIYYASQKINQPVQIDDAAREEIARAADTRPIRFTPAPEAAAPALAQAPVAPKAAPVAAPAAPKMALASAVPATVPAKPAISEAKVVKAGLDRFPAPAFARTEPRPAPRLAKAEPVAKPLPATRQVIAPKLASAAPAKKPVTLSTVVKPVRSAGHHDSFAATFASMPAPSLETGVATGTASLVIAPEAPAVAMQIAPVEAPTPLAAAAPAPAPEIIAQPVNPTTSVAELPATDGKS